MWLPERWHQPVYWCCGGTGDSRCSASFLPVGVSEATPGPIGSQGLSPFAWEKPTYNSCLLLSSQGPDFGKGLAALAVGTELGEVNSHVCLCVNSVLVLTTGEGFQTGSWIWDGRGRLGICLRSCPFLRREAIYDLTHFLLKLCEYFLLILLTWTPRKQESISNNLLSVFCFFPCADPGREPHKAVMGDEREKALLQEDLPPSSASCPGSGTVVGLLGKPTHGGNRGSFIASEACQGEWSWRW